MPRETMQRTAADNDYLHKDFHGALSVGLDYLQKTYGPAAVKDYLRHFTLSFYAPVRNEIKNLGLSALAEHYRRVYDIEQADYTLDCNDDEMTLKVTACPAVTYMRQCGYPVAEMFVETVRTVNEALCEDTPFAAELVEYDEQTGRSVQKFYRRSAK